MQEIQWMQEAMKRKSSLLKDLQGLLRINSVLDEQATSPDAPLGDGVKAALQYVLDLGKKDEFQTKNVGNLAGHVEMGAGKELVGILCHVDVVPEGEGWSFAPFGGEMKDGKIYARGAIDDKGPTMAAYYAMKIVKELGLPIEKRVRLIVGTDEESNWRCVDRYFAEEEMPTLGFAPDASFPIIHAEKGIADFDFVMPAKEEEGTKNIFLHSFQAGERYNMVPSFARARLYVRGEQTSIVQCFDDYCQKHHLKGSYYVESGDLIFELEGVSAHGMEPEKGVNAGLHLIVFLSELSLTGKAKNFLDFGRQFLWNDTRGNALDIAYEDDVTGELTVNAGMIAYSHTEGARFGINMRYPVTFDIEKGKQLLSKCIESFDGHLDRFTDLKPHYVDENHRLIQILQKVYEEQTGEQAALLSIGGGTYARSLKAGVAFGALFPGCPDVAHQKDEYMDIDDLLKATAIYAQAIYELASE
ncbi:dipeptidase PepV [Bacillus chungangensis]|uniref:Succinyl-diaminopimelate desuccinylase n=1 Tax=Bacillus chungangensis TaxID=587633 RepID=A0ABT9WUC1_9BACI|nr:dipeptidase PepV [Bacillus chungangensis]MDQ0176889.1 succinyl-diaminopimelate desuccinylase [Bacillus chungangensis]